MLLKDNLKDFRDKQKERNTRIDRIKWRKLDDEQNGNAYQNLKWMSDTVKNIVEISA